MQEFDLVIIGSGLVGASLAAALRDSNLNIALVESLPPLQDCPETDTNWDSRIYTITPGNAEFLRECGAWQTMNASRIQPVHAMRVFGDENSEIDFDALQTGVPELNFILENRELQFALEQRLKQLDNLTLFQPSRCRTLQWDADFAQLTLEDGRILKARLIVGADGRDSWVRKQAGILATPVSYHQHGVVANFTCEKSHFNTAYQWFQPEGILALLPLPQHKVSMVWSVSPEKSAELLALSPEKLGEAVSAASHHMLGSLSLITPPASFPLRLLKLPDIVAPRLALIGDAAHNVHPLAGQGVNLGFRDARQLADILLQRGACIDCGDPALLRRYQRSREEDIASMLATTNALKHLFNNSNPLLRNLRNTGLSLVNRMQPLKKLLAQHALN